MTRVNKSEKYNLLYRSPPRDKVRCPPASLCQPAAMARPWADDRWRHSVTSDNGIISEGKVTPRGSVTRRTCQWRCLRQTAYQCLWWPSCDSRGETSHRTSRCLAVSAPSRYQGRGVIVPISREVIRGWSQAVRVTGLVFVVLFMPLFIIYFLFVRQQMLVLEKWTNEDFTVCK